MLSAKSIEQELQRIESKLDVLLGMINKLEDRMNAERIKATAEAHAWHSLGQHTIGQRQTDEESGT